MQPQTRKLDIVTLGETMIRLTAPRHMRIEQAIQFDVHVGGAETNVAVAMARLGKRAAWVSRLPDNPMGHIVANTLRQYGVDVSGITWDANARMGLYFLEMGSAPRSARVWYDRANSAASQLSPADLPLDLIASAGWLHITGITPALSASCTETVRAAFGHAKKHHLTCSFDVNYRALLWSPEQASAALEPLCKMADVVMVAMRDAKKLFGAPENSAASELQRRWGGTVVVTCGADGAQADDGSGLVTCAAFPTTLVERLGAGDAFASGVICCLMEGAPLPEALRFGTALAALKLTIPGDLALVSRREVEDVIAQGGQSIHR